MRKNGDAAGPGEGLLPRGNDEQLHNFARVCFPSEFVKTMKDGRRIRAHVADKSCAFYKHFTLVISNLAFPIDAFTVTPERRLLA